MAVGVNKVILIGLVGRDVEIKEFQNGTKVGNASLATGASYKDKSGNKVDKTEWHRLVFMGKLVDISKMYIKKGNKVYIEGCLQTRKYTNSNNIETSSTEVLVNSLTLIQSKHPVNTGDDDDFGNRHDHSAQEDCHSLPF